MRSQKTLKKKKKRISYIKNNQAFESKDQRLVNKLVPQICILDTLVDTCLLHLYSTPSFRKLHPVQCGLN